MPNEFIIKNGYFSQGSSQITGSLNVSAGITGSLLGTASYATTALSASFISTASYALNSLSASFASNALTASFVQTAQTASYVLNAVSSSFSTTASFFAAKGADTTIQFNKAGAFSGSSYFRYNHATESLQLGYTANPIQAIGRYSIAQGYESFAYTTGSVALNYNSKAGSLGYLATTSSADTNIILIDASYGDVSSFFSADPYVVTDDNDFNIFTLGTSVINVNINDPSPVGFDGTNTWISCSGDYNGTPVSSLYTTPFYVASYFSAAPDNSNKYIGRYATAFNQSRAVGQGSIALLGGSAYGINSLALGLQGISIGDGAVAINGTAYGTRTISFRGNARGVFSFTHGGNNTTADSATGAHAEGTGTLASASYAHAEGSTTNATGYASHTEGDSTIAQGTAAHAEGLLTYAQGEYSHAEGVLTVAKGNYSHAEGAQTSGSGEGSHAEGFQTEALGNYSHAEGWNTIASGSFQSVVGQFNSQGNNSSLFIIGNGTSIGARSDLALFNKTNIDFKKSLLITGSLNVSGGITGSLLGTASFAVSASWAPAQPATAPPSVNLYTFNNFT